MLKGMNYKMENCRIPYHKQHHFSKNPPVSPFRPGQNQQKSASLSLKNFRKIIISKAAERFTLADPICLLQRSFQDLKPDWKVYWKSVFIPERLVPINFLSVLQNSPQAYKITRNRMLYQIRFHFSPAFCFSVLTKTRQRHTPLLFVMVR